MRGRLETIVILRGFLRSPKRAIKLSVFSQGLKLTEYIYKLLNVMRYAKLLITFKFATYIYYGFNSR